MASVSFSIEVSVSDRLDAYCKKVNAKRNPKRQLTSRTEAIDDLLKVQGF